MWLRLHDLNSARIKDVYGGKKAYRALGELRARNFIYRAKLHKPVYKGRIHITPGAWSLTPEGIAWVDNYLAQLEEEAEAMINGLG